VSLSSIYLAISSERRLGILAALRQSRCLSFEELSRQLNLDIATLLYEVNLLQHGGLVSTCEGSVCLTDRGQYVISKIISLDQDLLSRISSRNSILRRFFNFITFKTLAVYIAASGSLSILPLILLSFLGLSLFYKFKINLILLVPLEFHTFNIMTVISSPIILFIYFTLLSWIISRKVLIIQSLEATLFTICIISLNTLVYYILIVIIGINTITLMLLEAMKLIIATIAIISTSTLISYYIGRTYESIFLIESLTLLIPCLILYALSR